MRNQTSSVVGIIAITLVALTACAPSGPTEDDYNRKACKQIAGIQSQNKLDASTMDDDELAAKTLDMLEAYQKVAIATPTPFGTSISNQVTAKRMTIASGTPTTNPGVTASMASVCSKLGVDLP